MGKLKQLTRNGFIIDSARKNHLVFDQLKILVAGSDRETRRRIICQLPYSFSYVPVETPYLDPSMFRFDDRLITLIERTKLADNDVIRLDLSLPVTLTF